MKFLPNEKLRFRSKLSDREILNRVSEIIEPKKIVRFRMKKPEGEKPYEGEIKGNKFKINRIIYYRNSFFPVINGVVKGDGHKTIIDIKMRMTLYTLIFSSLLCLPAVIGFFTTLYSSFAESQFKLEIIFPAGMLAFVYAMSMIGFKRESKKSKMYLAKLFESDIN